MPFSLSLSLSLFLSFDRRAPPLVLPAGRFRTIARAETEKANATGVARVAAGGFDSASPSCAVVRSRRSNASDLRTFGYRWHVRSLRSL